LYPLLRCCRCLFRRFQLVPAPIINRKLRLLLRVTSSHIRATIRLLKQPMPRLVLTKAARALYLCLRRTFWQNPAKRKLLTRGQLRPFRYVRPLSVRFWEQLSFNRNRQLLIQVNIYLFSRSPRPRALLRARKGNKSKQNLGCVATD